jgi:hypothetical protein
MRRLILAWILVFAAWCGTSQVLAQSALKLEELDQLLAPIALYPDSLLSNVLMASTYPMEVVEAERRAQ